MKNLLTKEQQKIWEHLENPMTKTQAIAQVLEDMSEGDLVSVWNEYAMEVGDESIFKNGECFFSEMFSTTDEAVRAVCYGNYHYIDAYVRFNGYGNLETTNDPEEWVNTTELAEWLCENESVEFDVSDVQDVMKTDFDYFLDNLGYTEEQIDGFDAYDMDQSFEANFIKFKAYLDGIDYGSI